MSPFYVEGDKKAQMVLKRKVGYNRRKILGSTPGPQDIRNPLEFEKENLKLKGG
jgi:hypothetical protein